MKTIPEYFRNANYEMVKYDGSPVSWRISIYGFVVENNSVLVVKHKDEKFWDIPGGGVEMGEELAETLSREGKEEAGWELTLIQPVSTHIDWFYHAGEEKFYRAIQFFWTAKGRKVGEPTEGKIEEVKFVPFDELEHLLNANGYEAFQKAVALKIIPSSK